MNGFQASAGITSLSAVRQGQPSSFVYLVMGLETGTVEVLDGRALGPEGDLFGVDTMMAEVDIGGGLPLPTSGWCGPLVCCPGKQTRLRRKIRGKEKRLVICLCALSLEMLIGLRREWFLLADLVLFAIGLR